MSAWPGRAFPIPVSELPQLPLGVMSGPESGVRSGAFGFGTNGFFHTVCSSLGFREGFDRAHMPQDNRQVRPEAKDMLIASYR